MAEETSRTHAVTLGNKQAAIHDKVPAKAPVKYAAIRAGTSTVQVNGGQASFAGRDVKFESHTHYHQRSTKPDFIAILNTINNHRTIHQSILRKRTPKTGEWIHGDELFCRWRGRERTVKVIWGSGIPGAGKSVLTSIVIDSFEAWAKRRSPEARICIAYVYFRYSDPIGNDLRDVLEVFVKQMIETDEKCFELAEKVYSRHANLETQPTEEELVGLLRSFATKASASFYFLGALDEAPSSLQFELVEILSSLDVQVFITSREMKSLQTRFPAAHCFLIAPTADDLDLHIKKEIDRSFDLCAILDQESPSFRRDIVLKIREKCGGMFLHASLQLNALKGCTSLYEVGQCLETFPAQIEEIYKQSWERIQGQKSATRVKVANAVLLWVLHSIRSLSTEDLQYAVAASLDRDSYRLDLRRISPLGVLIPICCGLVTVDDQAGTVNLVHYTAKEVLQRLLTPVFPRPHAVLSAVCMKHLECQGLQSWSSPTLTDTLECIPFLSYAYDAWACHSSKSLGTITSEKQITEFIDSCQTFPVVDKAGQRLRSLNPLQVLVWFDLPLHLVTPARRRAEIVKVHWDGDTLLHMACRLRSYTSAQGLVNLPHPLVNLFNKEKNTPLALAAWNRDEEMVELLLGDHAINVNMGGIEGTSALMWALRSGSVAIVERLLGNRRIRVDTRSRQGQTPLILATCHKECSAALVQALLRHTDIDVNLGDNCGTTPLSLASKAGNIPVVSLLLDDPRVDPDREDQLGRNPLIFAAKKGNGAIAKLLLAHPRTNVNKMDRDGRTPLSWACACTWDSSTTEILLQHSGTSPSLPDYSGRSPLDWARSSENTTAVDLLVSRLKSSISSSSSEEADSSSAVPPRVSFLERWELDVPFGDPRAGDDRWAFTQRGIAGTNVDFYRRTGVFALHMTHGAIHILTIPTKISRYPELLR